MSTRGHTPSSIPPPAYTQEKSMAYEALFCLVCGRDLEHKPTGRPRRFCSARCKQRDYREIRRWASAAVDAAMAKLPEPPMRWRYMVRYELRTGGAYQHPGFTGRDSLVTEHTEAGRSDGR